MVKNKLSILLFLKIKMGAGNSIIPVSQHRTWSVEPPPLPAPPFLSNVRSPSSETSTNNRDIEDATENATNKTCTTTFDGPLSQVQEKLSNKK